MSGINDFVMVSEADIFGPAPPLEETSEPLRYPSGASSSLMSTESGGGFNSKEITSGERRFWDAHVAGNPEPVPSSSRTAGTPMRIPDLEAESVEVSAEVLIHHPSLARAIRNELQDVDPELLHNISGIGEVNRSDASMLSATANNSLPIQFPNSTEVRREQRNGLAVHSQEYALQTDIVGYRGNHFENSS